MLQPTLLLLLLAVSLLPVCGQKISEASVLEGSTVTLRCPRYRWGRKTCWIRSCEHCDGDACIQNDLEQIRMTGAMDLVISNIHPEHSGTYSCYTGNRFFYYGKFKLTVVKGCTRDLMDNTAFPGNDISNHKFSESATALKCRERCTKDQGCQIFTFHKNRKCYLKASPAGTTPINIKYVKTRTSGYSLRNCSGIVIHPAKKYSLVSEVKNWTEAQAYCQQHYTDLASIHTAADWEAVKQELRSSSRNVWIGLHREDSNKPWKWSTGENHMYLKWQHGHPTTNGHKCVYSSESTWKETPCNATNVNNHVCQDVHQVNGTTTKTYKNVAGGSINMSAAQLDCESRNKTLASILNQEEQEAFDEVAQKQTWIGLHYNLTINKWKWSSEEPFEAWDEEGEEHFVVINTDKTWQAKNCREQEHFLCFGDANPVNDTTIDPTIPTLDYLHYYKTPKTWLAALEFCKDQNSTLVHITNSTVQEDVTWLLDSEDLPWGVWIGLERFIFQSNARWVWVSGEEVNFTQWHQCFPLNTPTLYCGKMIWDDDEESTLKWLGASCQEELPFICQDLNH